MGYFDLGMVLAIILSPIVIYYYITINNEMMELTNWWNGESYDGDFFLLEILVTIIVVLLTFLLTLVFYPVVIGVAIITMMIISLKNKRLAKINKKKEN